MKESVSYKKMSFYNSHLGEKPGYLIRDDALKKPSVLSKFKPG